MVRAPGLGAWRDVVESAPVAMSSRSNAAQIAGIGRVSLVASPILGPEWLINHEG
jgi:hypothetical protein